MCEVTEIRRATLGGFMMPRSPFIISQTVRCHRWGNLSPLKAWFLICVVSFFSSVSSFLSVPFSFFPPLAVRSIMLTTEKAGLRLITWVEGRGKAPNPASTCHSLHLSPFSQSTYCTVTSSVTAGTKWTQTGSVFSFALHSVSFVQWQLFLPDRTFRLGCRLIQFQFNCLSGCECMI